MRTCAVRNGWAHCAQALYSCVCAGARKMEKCGKNICRKINRSLLDAIESTEPCMLNKRKQTCTCMVMLYRYRGDGDGDGGGGYGIAATICDARPAPAASHAASSAAVTSTHAVGPVEATLNDASRVCALDIAASAASVAGVLSTGVSHGKRICGAGMGGVTSASAAAEKTASAYS